LFCLKSRICSVLLVNVIDDGPHEARCHDSQHLIKRFEYINQHDEAVIAATGTTTYLLFLLGTSLPCSTTTSNCLCKTSSIAAAKIDIDASKLL
jgi:hypothetical protein